MPKKFSISQEEKENILSLHENVNKTKPISEQVIKGRGGDPWEYKKEGNVYYTRKQGTNKWIKTSGKVSNAIATKIFKSKPSSKKSDTSNRTNVPMTRDDRTAQRDTFDPYHQETQKMIQMAKFFRKDLIGVISDKSHKQLMKMMLERSLSNKSFIIVNKDAAIASLFGPGYSFVTKSPITTGYVKDTGSKEDVLTYKKWFNFTKEYMLKNIKSPEYIANKKFADSLGISVKDLDYNKHVKTSKNKFKFSYTVLKEKGYAKTPSGTYKLGSGHNVKGYSGDGKNTFPLIDIDSGERLPAAVHGAAGKKRDELINKAGSLDTKASKEFTRAGSGCTNVNAKFIADMQKTKPEYVIILPDSGTTVDIPKMVTIKTWSDKILSMGEACAKSFYSLFS